MQTGNSRGSAAPACLRRSRTSRPLALLLLVVLLGGCYSYAPMQGSSPARGSRIRVNLLRPQDVRLTEFTANDAVSIMGEIVRADERQVVLSAIQVTSESGYENRGIGETVVIPRTNIRSVQKSRLSIVQSAGLTGVVVLLGMLVGVAMNDAGGGGTAPPLGGQPQ